jgi:hypothetical protein
MYFRPLPSQDVPGVWPRKATYTYLYIYIVFRPHLGSCRPAFERVLVGGSSLTAGSGGWEAHRIRRGVWVSAAPTIHAHVQNSWPRLDRESAFRPELDPEGPGPSSISTDFQLPSRMQSQFVTNSTRFCALAASEMYMFRIILWGVWGSPPKIKQGVWGAATPPAGGLGGGSPQNKGVPGSASPPTRGQKLI